MNNTDAASPLYAAIDWSRSVIAGSHALHQYLGEHDAWTPNDIDIMCEVKTHADFCRLVDAFKEKVDAPGETRKLLTPEMRAEATRENAANGREERFHHSILATSTLTVKGINKPVQFVGLEVDAGRTLLSHLNDTTDLPACVSYTVTEEHRRIFHVPERGLPALRTRRVSCLHTCPARIGKYKQRGFVFD